MGGVGAIHGSFAVTVLQLINSLWQYYFVVATGQVPVAVATLHLLQIHAQYAGNPYAPHILSSVVWR